MSSKRCIHCVFSISLIVLCTSLSVSPTHAKGFDKRATPAAANVSDWKLTASRPENQRYLRSLQATERKYGIPEDMLVRVAYQESRFRPDVISGKVISPAGAVGIMQIIPDCHPGVDPLNPFEAIDYAGSYLRELFDEFGSWDLAVAAYNWGPGNLRRFGLKKAPRETQLYYASIVGVPAILSEATNTRSESGRVTASAIARTSKAVMQHRQPALVQSFVERARSMFESARTWVQSAGSAQQQTSQVGWLRESR